MQKTYLINHYKENLNFPKNSKIVFRNEYLFFLYKHKILKRYKCSFVENLNTVYNKNKDQNFIKIKLKKYRNYLSKSLNKIHNVYFSKYEWGILLDYYLIVSIFMINLKLRNFKKIKNRKIFCKVLNKEFFFLDTKAFHDEIFLNNDLNKYIDYLVLNGLGFKNLKKINNKNKKDNKIVKKSSFGDKISYFFLKIITKFSTISIISSGYFGLKNSLILFFFSKFKIFFLNSNFFRLSDGIFLFKSKRRNHLMIPEDDIFDKIFNQYNKNVFPSSFFENFEKFYRYEDDICKRIKNLGSAVLFLESDIYRFFAMKIKRRGGKLINFQHGGLNRMRKFSLEEFFVDRYADLDFWWHDKNGIGVPYFDNHKPKYKNNDEILFFPTINLYQETTVNLKKCNHIYLNQYWKFFELMKNCLKDKVKIKLMHHKNSDSLKRIWEKRYNKNIILNKNNYKGSVFKNFKIVIIDNYSTPLFELLYISHPFIIINDSKLIEYNKDFREIVQKLNEIGVLFKSEIQAAQFINSNYQNIDLWWKKIIKKKQFRQIKKKLYPKEKFDYQKLFYKLEK